MYFSNRRRLKNVRCILITSLLIFALVLPGGIYHPKKAKAEPITVGFVALVISVSFVGGCVIGIWKYCLTTPIQNWDYLDACNAMLVSGVRSSITGIGAIFTPHLTWGIKVAEIAVDAAFDIGLTVTLDVYLEEILRPYLGPVCAIDLFLHYPTKANLQIVKDELETLKNTISNDPDILTLAQDLVNLVDPSTDAITQRVRVNGIYCEIPTQSDYVFELPYNKSFNFSGTLETDDLEDYVSMEVMIKNGENWIPFDYAGFGNVLGQVTYTSGYLTGNDLLRWAGLPENTPGTVEISLRANVYEDDSIVQTINYYDDTSTLPGFQDTDSPNIVEINIIPDTHPYFSSPGIAPSNPTINENVIFSIQYNDEDGDLVDDGSVNVFVDSTEYLMTGPSNESGTIFSSAGQTFSEGTHNYYFTGTQYGEQFRYPSGSSTLSFTVTENSPDGLSISANPPSITICGLESSQITATLTNGGYPVEGQEVAFVILEGSGYLSQTTDETNSQGKAFTTFTPDSIGITTIGAIVNGLPIAQTNVVVSNCSANIDIVMFLDSCDETSSKYEIEAEITNSSSGEPLGNADVTISVKKLDGSYFGELYDQGITGNPITTTTSAYGDVDVLLTVTEASDIQVFVECNSTTKIINNNVYAGCIEPTIIEPFTEIPINVTNWPTNAIAISPDGNKLATLKGRDVVIFKIDKWQRTGEWMPWLSLPHPGGENALCVAWSPDGNYLAAGFEDPGSNDPGLIVWNTGNNTEDFSVRYERMQSDSYEDVYSISWSPGSNYLMTGERLISPNGGRARIWNLSGSNTWTSPQGADDVNAVAWASSDYKAVGFNVGEVRIYNSSNSLRATIPSWDEQQVYSLAWNPDGTLLAVGVDNAGAHSPIYVYDTNGTQTGSFSEHDNAVTGLNWHTITGKLVSCGYTQDIRVWESQGSPSLIFGSGSLVDVAWTENGQEVLAADCSSDKLYVYAPYDGSGPMITIQQPSDNYQTNNSSITIIGSIHDTHLVDTAQISINGGTATELTLDEDNNFIYFVALVEGINTITIDAGDGCSNASSKSITVERIIPIPDFLISSSPQTQSAGPDENAVYSINLVAINEFSSPLTLSAFGLPADTTCDFSENPTTPSSTVNLTLTPSVITPIGLYEITVSASGGGKSHQITVDLVVNQPEISIQSDNKGIPDGTEEFPFGNVSVGSNSSVTFKIENLGNASLNLSGSPIVQISGTNAADFRVTQQPPASVCPGGLVSFTIQFTPGDVGQRSAAVSINNNDSDENPYNFTITGIGTEVIVAPIINPIPDHSTTEGHVYTGPTPSLSQGTMPVTWSKITGPEDMTINGTTGVVSWLNPTSVGSTFTVTILATNSAGDDLESWQVTVTAANDICEGDFDADSDVDGSDLATFAADFGRTDCDTGDPCEGDFDGDNDVDGSDLAVFAADFGRTDCP